MSSLSGSPRQDSAGPHGTCLSVAEWRYGSRGEVEADTVQAYRVAPSAGPVACDIHRHLHHHRGLDESDVQDVARTPPGGEPAARPRMTARRWCQDLRERDGCVAGEGGVRPV